MASPNNLDPALYDAWASTFSKYGLSGLLRAFQNLPDSAWPKGEKQLCQMMVRAEIMIFQAAETAIFARDHGYINSTQFEAYCKQLYEISEVELDVLFEHFADYSRREPNIRLGVMMLYMTHYLPQTDYTEYFCSKFIACIRIATYKNVASKFGDEKRAGEFAQLEQQADEIFVDSIEGCKSGGGYVHFVSYRDSLYGLVNVEGDTITYTYNTRAEAEADALRLRNNETDPSARQAEAYTITYRKALTILPYMQTQGIKRLALHNIDQSKERIFTNENLLITIRKIVAETDELEFVKHASKAYGIPEQTADTMPQTRMTSSSTVGPTLTPQASGPTNTSPPQVSCGICKRVLEPAHRALACPRCGSNEKAYNDPHAIKPEPSIVGAVIFWVIVVICALGFIGKLMNESARQRRQGSLMNVQGVVCALRPNYSQEPVCSRDTVQVTVADT